MTRLIIPGTFPDLNEIIAAAKSHFGNYSSMKSDNTETVAWLAKGLPKVKRAVIVCHWYCRDRRKDPDNISAGCKFILDGLVKAGVLANDGWRQVAGIEHWFEVDKKNPRVEIELKPV